MTSLMIASRLEPYQLLNCRMFAKEVWTDNVLLRVRLDFTHVQLHEILHANEEYYYDECPGADVVRKWFIEFAKEVS